MSVYWLVCTLFVVFQKFVGQQNNHLGSGMISECSHFCFIYFCLGTKASCNGAYIRSETGLTNNTNMFKPGMLMRP